jgi:hypothetical protein
MDLDLEIADEEGGEDRSMRRHESWRLVSDTSRDNPLLMTNNISRSSGITAAVKTAYIAEGAKSQDYTCS